MIRFRPPLPQFFSSTLHRKKPWVTPPRILVLSFVLLIALGTLLLKIPGLSLKPDLPWIDAFFTAASAVCVTGLVVVDTGTAWSPAAQAIILLLIQAGALGLMTIYVLFYRLVGLNLSLRDELAVRGSLSYKPEQEIRGLVRDVALLTITVEAVGALLLFFFWLPDFEAGRAAWLAVFHSVSAFCNAGFSLWPDSLTRYGTHPGVNLTVMGLIIIGGLGFIVIKDILDFRRRRRFFLSLHSKIVLFSTLALICAGTLFLLFFEWPNTLAGKSPGDKFLLALFQSVTTRTAGFNTLDHFHMTNAGLMLTILFMFIGGSPGSTAGGIKTATAAVAVSMALSRFRGFGRTNLFKRSLPDGADARALTIIIVGIAIIFLALTALLSTETSHLDHSQTRDIFMELLFETVSAFGTVGLSMGVTSGLTDSGKLIIIGTMFLGRVGPLTLVMALIGRQSGSKPYNYGTEEVMIG